MPRRCSAAGTWITARRITIPLALPALLAGALVAFLQAMTLFGSPAILALPAGFHTMTTKIWSLFQYPPKPELAAAASLPLLVLTVMLLRAEHMILGRALLCGARRQEQRAAHHPARLAGMAGAGASASSCCCKPVFLPYGALLNAAFSQGRVAARDVRRTSRFHNIYFVFFELSATKLALYNTFVLGIATATIGTVLALVIAYLTTREAVTGHHALGFLATAPVAIPGIVLGVGLFLSYTRPPFVLYGTLWILLLAFLTLELPAAYQQMQSAFKAIHPELEDASRILGATRLHGAAPDHRAAAAHLGDRDLVLRVRRHDPRAVGGDHAVHLGDQGDLGADLRSQRERRPRGDLGARPDHAGRHLGDRRAGQSAAHRRRQRETAGQLSRFCPRMLVRSL